MATSAFPWSSLKKKFLSPERRSIALTGRLAGPGGWQAPFFIYLCCVVYQNQSLQMRQRVTCLAAEIRPFRSFSAQKSGLSVRTALIVFCGFGHKNVLKKKIRAPERTVDQKRADNPGSERAGVNI